MVETTDAQVAKALATPTRAAILDLLRARGGLAAKEVAAASGIHANVARSHLEILVAAGLARYGWRRNPLGGRPAKVYEAVPVHVSDGGQLVTEMLATLLEAAGPDAEAARRVAERTGERLGRRFQPAPDAPFEALVEAMMRALGAISGGVSVVDRGEDWVEVDDVDCPFKSIAAEHAQVACTLDKALKEGIMRGLGAETFVEQVTSIAWGDPSCREVVRLR